MGKPQEEKNKKNQLPWYLRLYEPRQNPPDEQNKKITEQLKQAVEDYKEFGPDAICQGQLQDITDRFEVGNFNAVDLSPAYFRVMTLVKGFIEDNIHNIATYLPDPIRPKILALKVIDTINKIRKNIQCATQIVSLINGLIEHYNNKLIEAQNAIQQSIDNAIALKDKIRNLNVAAMLKKFGEDALQDMIYQYLSLTGAADLFAAADACLQAAERFRQEAIQLKEQEFTALKQLRDSWHAQPPDKGPTGGTSFVGSVNPGPKSLWGVDEHKDVAFKDIPEESQEAIRLLRGLEKTHQTMAQQFEDAGKSVQVMEEARDAIPDKIKELFELEPNIEVVPSNLEQLSDEILELVQGLESTEDNSPNEYSRLDKQNFFQFGVVASEEAAAPLVKVDFPKPYDEVPERITVTLKILDDAIPDSINLDDPDSATTALLEEFSTLPSVATLQHSTTGFMIYIGAHAFSKEQEPVLNEAFTLTGTTDPSDPSPPEKETERVTWGHKIPWQLQWQAVGIREQSSDQNDELLQEIEQIFEAFEQRIEQGIPGTPTGASSTPIGGDDNGGSGNDSSSQDGDLVGTIHPNLGGSKPMPLTVSEHKLSGDEFTLGAWTPIASGSEGMEFINLSYNLISNAHINFKIRLKINGETVIEAPLSAFMINIDDGNQTPTGTVSSTSFWHDRFKVTSGNWSVEIFNPSIDSTFFKLVLVLGRYS